MADPKQPASRNIIEQFEFRWWLVALPLAVVIVIWLISRVEAPVCWEDVLQEMVIVDRPRYSAACTLAAISASLIAAVRIVTRD